MPHTFRARPPHDPDLLAWRDLVAAMSDCDRLDAAMVGLVYFDGLTHRGVADRLDVPLAHVHAGVARAMQCIGQTLTGAPGPRRVGPVAG